MRNKETTYVVVDCPCAGGCTICPCFEGQMIVDERDLLETMIDAVSIDGVLFFESSAEAA